MSFAVTSSAGEVVCVRRPEVSASSNKSCQFTCVARGAKAASQAKLAKGLGSKSLKFSVASLKSHNYGSRSSTASTVAAKAAEADAEQVEAGIDPTKEQKFGFVIANARFMLDQNEDMAEVLRERKRLFGEKGRPMDYFIVPEPAWIEDLPEDVKARLGRPAAAIVSTDLPWITFMKVRLDKVYASECEATLEQMTASAGTVPDEFAPEPNAKWTAPYAKYKSDWWKAFVREQ